MRIAREGRADRPALLAVVRNAGLHQHRAQVGVAQAQRAELVGELRDLLGREAGHQHRDLQHDRPQADARACSPRCRSGGSRRRRTCSTLSDARLHAVSSRNMYSEQLWTVRPLAMNELVTGSVRSKTCCCADRGQAGNAFPVACTRRPAVPFAPAGLQVLSRDLPAARRCGSRTPAGCSRGSAACGSKCQCGCSSGCQSPAAASARQGPIGLAAVRGLRSAPTGRDAMRRRAASPDQTIELQRGLQDVALGARLHLDRRRVDLAPPHACRFDSARIDRPPIRSTARS